MSVTGSVRRVDAAHEIVDVGHELLLEDEVALVDLSHVVAGQPEDPVVVAVRRVESGWAAISGRLPTGDDGPVCRMAGHELVV